MQFSTYSLEKFAEHRERELQAALARRRLLETAGPASESRKRSSAIRLAALVTALFRAS